MAGITLKQAVFKYADLTQAINDEDLERKWDWQDYEEGVRFAFFRNYEDLRTLAIHLGNLRINAGMPPTSAQRILAQHILAYRDLQAVLLGWNEPLAQKSPAEGEWSVWDALAHIVSAEGTFFAINLYALEGRRSKDGRPLKMPEETWEAFWANDTFETIAASRQMKDLLVYYDQLHARVIDEFSGISEEELDIPVMFWERSPLPLRFRLHRFDSHLRQHSIQIEKVLATVGQPMNESKRLLRLIYQALAEVEGSCMGLPELGRDEKAEAARHITARSQEIASILAIPGYWQADLA
ncbi:MAG TPA: DinB family protein [Anaerolineales bacterium]|nr:DinB family protein [Anaerolineales bacterium]